VTAPAPRRRPALEALAGLALLGLAAAAFLHQRALAPAMPYSDESAHLAKLVELADRLSQATGATWLHRLLLADDAYPNLTYALTLAWPGGAGSVAGARLSLLLYPLVHALVALLVARASWGRAAAWAYALLVLFSPVGLFPPPGAHGSWPPPAAPPAPGASPCSSWARAAAWPRRADRPRARASGCR